MYLKVTDAAKVQIDKYLSEDSLVILDLDDGVGEYSKLGVCSLDTSFRILLLDKEQSHGDFGTTFDSDIGRIYIKDYSKIYLDEQMTLDFDPRLFNFTLKSGGGTLDAYVPVVDLRPLAK